MESLNLFELYKQKKDFKSVGLNVSDIDIHLNKIFALPVSLVILSLLSSILMLNIKFKQSTTRTLIFGILLLIIIYYIYYFFRLLGSNNKIPIICHMVTKFIIIFELFDWNCKYQ